MRHCVNNCSMYHALSHPADEHRSLPSRPCSTLFRAADTRDSDISFNHVLVSAVALDIIIKGAGGEVSIVKATTGTTPTYNVLRTSSSSTNLNTREAYTSLHYPNPHPSSSSPPTPPQP